MALGRESISAARSINSEVYNMGIAMKGCFNEMMSSCSSNPAFQSFVTETDIGMSLAQRLEKLTQAMNATGEQMMKVSSATNDFLNNQERINAGR